MRGKTKGTRVFVDALAFLLTVVLVLAGMVLLLSLAVELTGTRWIFLSLCCVAVVALMWGLLNYVEPKKYRK